MAPGGAVASTALSKLRAESRRASPLPCSSRVTTASAAVNFTPSSRRSSTPRYPSFGVERGGRWRFVEHSPQGVHGFEGHYREIAPPDRIVQTFEWDGMPGYVSIETATFEDLGDGRTRVVHTTLFHTTEERDGMLRSGMEKGLGEGYAALDKLLAS
jgi:uncharacterized protein YndB with AHSA1/START domain